MKKIFCLSVTVIAFGLFCFGCGSTGGEPSTGSPETVFRDNFDGYSIGLLSNGTNGWNASGNMNIAVKSGADKILTYLTDAIIYDHILNDHKSDDYTVTANVEFVTGGDPGPSFGLLSRVNTAGDNWYGLVIQPVKSIKIIKYNGVSVSTLSSGTFDVTFDHDASYDLTFICSGSNLEGTVSDGSHTRTITCTESSYSSGKFGFGMLTSGTPTEFKFNDVVVTEP